ncbi:hypothetical protein HNP84_002489 [Thermocatellispora tengchongensis]|uniref:Uncharacterized protein n=1 Tax=Thermocatellispora tengchongensis TaxID=1073253 RepID=A0A840NZ50_9ACTN|nr:hypothetical protein [Thermocatellispora tengchongensis]MBB5132768.1 hypothetical protein [Thermocatellispora tengchongensis]
MKHVVAAVRRYRMELPGHEWFAPRTTDNLNQVVDSIRLARLAGLPLVVSLTALTVERVPACTWCRARPRVFEYDCDGPYMSSNCGSSQCAEARHLAYEGVIAYPSYRRSDQQLRLVKPVRVHSSDDPIPGVVTVDEDDEITCLCGNVSSFAGFHPCLPGGALVERDEPTGLFWCGGGGCPGVIVDCRRLDDIEPEESVTDAFPVEIQDQCNDCEARWDAPPQEHAFSCSVNWR